MSIEEEKEIPTNEIEQEETPKDEIEPEEILINEIEPEEILINEIEPEEILINEIEREVTPTDEIKEVPIPDQIETKEDIVPITRPTSARVIEQPMIIEQRLVPPVQVETREIDKAPSVSSTMTLAQPSIRVSINGVINPGSTTTTTPKSRIDRSPTRTSRSNKSSSSPRKTPITELRRYLLNKIILNKSSWF